MVLHSHPGEVNWFVFLVSLMMCVLWFCYGKKLSWYCGSAYGLEYEFQLG